MNSVRNNFNSEFFSMKKIFLFLVFVFSLSEISSAQIVKDAVNWSYSTKELGGGIIELTFSTLIKDGFHAYSKEENPDFTPAPGVLSFEKNKNFELVGTWKEAGNKVEVDEPSLKEHYIEFTNNLKLIQKIKLLKKSVNIKGTVDYQICNEAYCIPTEYTIYNFNIELHSDAVNETVLLSDTAKKDPSAQTDTVKVDTTSKSTSEIKPIQITNENATDPLWKIFLYGFGSGLLALIQPCVFPIIPLTVSFFTKRSKTKAQGRINAMVYAGSILVIFIVFGFLVSLLFGSDALNSWSSSWLFNLVFFVLLFLFALSFLGVFEITLPNSWINKTEAAADKGGYLGIFFMAFSLVLISFSCTVPIIGNLLPLITKGDALRPLVGLGSFGLALAIPFGFFAWFPGFLQSLPRSGGWMNTVKVTLGFLELALCLIYLSKVDLAYHWGILSRDIFLVLWVIIFAVLGLYLIGKIKLSHDGDLPHISVGRLLTAILALSISLYLFPGIFGAPLKPISGYLPPQATQDFDLSKILIEGFSSGANSSDTTTTRHNYSDIFHSPHGIPAYFDYDEGIAAAKKLHKPVMLDFTGWACVNCRKMEASVWRDAEVLKRLKNDYVLISMFVDDKTELPSEKRYVSKYSGKEIVTLGNWYSDIQASQYQSNTQPLYVLLDNNNQLLAQPRSYNADVDAYVKWLDQGLTEYQKRK